MPLTRREKAGYATTGVGGALVYGSAQLTERGINNANAVTGAPRRKLPGLRAMQATRGVKGTGKARLQFAGGNVGRAVGTVGVLGGASEVYRGRKWRKDNPNNVILRKGLIREGLKGNVEATKQRIENLKEGKPVGALAVATGVGAGTGAAGSFGAHAVLDRTRFKGTKSRPGLVAMGGLAGLAGSTKISNKVLERTHPEYKVTPAGVQRKKTAAVRPSSKAAVFNQKQMGRSAFRQATVPSDVRKSATMTDGQKRAAIFAAGSIPVVGDFSAAATAGRLARPENQRKAAATQLAGNLGGSVAGGLAGAALAGEAARRSTRARGKLVQANNYVERKKTAALKPVTDRLPQRAAKPSAAGAARSSWAAKVPKPRMPARYAGLGGAVAFGGLAGQMAGGQVGGYKATSRNLARDRKSAGNVSKVLWRKSKTQQELDRQTARRKRISGFMSTTGGAVGTTAFGAMVAAKRPSIAAKRPKLADQARDIGLVGGGIGGVNAMYFGRVQRKEAKQLVANQPVKKSETLRRHARKGQANVRLKTLDPYRRAPGLRWKNQEHTAHIALQMKRKGYDKSKPVHVQLWNGKEVFIDDGAHRMWAADMAGRKTVPIKITQHRGRNPRRSSGALNRTFDDFRTSRFHAQRRRTMNLDTRKLQSMSRRQATGWQARQNAKWSARGEKRASTRGHLVAMT